jgi:hypothetical protein
MYALNNVTTEDEFTSANTLECPGTRELNITVGNKAIFIQYAFRVQGYTGMSIPWSPDNGLYIPPGFHTRAYNVDGVRVRSAVAGVPAQVTIEAVN